MNEKEETLEDFLKRPINEYKSSDGYLNQIQSFDWLETNVLLYYLSEAVQIRYSYEELKKFVDPEVIKEKKQLRRKLLNFIHLLAEANKKIQIEDSLPKEE